jgi:hypothetical protein
MMAKKSQLTRLNKKENKKKKENEAANEKVQCEVVILNTQQSIFPCLELCKY